MITIKLLGIDAFLAIELTKGLHDKLVHAYDVDDEDIVFYAPGGFIIHNGVEQAAFLLKVEVEAPYGNEGKEEEIKDILTEAFKDAAIHFHIIFKYFDPQHEYVMVNENYPLFLTDDNVVKAHHHEEEEEELEEEMDEPYMGNILSRFDEYIKDHPNATNEEIYQVITDIRKEEEDKHNHKEEN